MDFPKEQRTPEREAVHPAKACILGTRKSRPIRLLFCLLYISIYFTSMADREREDDEFVVLDGAD